MKGFTFALYTLLSILSSETVVAFTTTSLNPAKSSIGKPNGSLSRYTASRCMSTGQTGSDEEVTFPYDEDAVRLAYNEWRVTYGKGEFDPVRFGNFRTNYKTITVSNLKERKKGTWMTLNEYGDYSVAEYEALLRGETLERPTLAVRSSFEKQVRTVRMLRRIIISLLFWWLT
jgi:hypothetical protein